MFRGQIVAVVVAALLSGHCLAKSPATAPASATSVATSQASGDIPDPVIAEILAQVSPKDMPADRSAMVKSLGEHLDKALTLGQAALDKYPQASNRHVVLNMMLDAALLKVRFSGDPTLTAKAEELSRQIVDSNAPRAEKLKADFFVTRQELFGKDRTAGKVEPNEVASAIDAFVARYDSTPYKARSLAMGALLARTGGQDAQADKMLDLLQKDYAQDEEIRSFLRMAGRSPDVGSPFVAQLTKLDGSKLNLPGDMMDKVYVVDFWATWCGPCVAELPHMKDVYAKYQPKGAEFVGISLDTADSRDKLEKFIKDEQIPWIQTFSGASWADPTSSKYGVQSIPAVWVIGRDGKVISSNARETLETILDKALATPTSAPEATSASAPAEN
ncbi:MAG: TlpA disulfide reductase family protein [Phycisphaerae bacterium]|jgi:thiol-disulfide isomerase/thioredoxin